MNKELANILTSYLMGWKSIRDVGEWLSSIDWTPDLNPQLQQLFGRFELIITEVLEGLRPQSELWLEASRFVAIESSSLYIQLAAISDVTFSASSNSSTASLLEPIVYATPMERQQTSWNILPQQAL
jgi:hypothetical protein